MVNPATIAPELDPLRVPIDELRGYPGNPRRGDLEAIRGSLMRNGQYRPIVVNRRTGQVLAGNHTWQAARELGWHDIAATFVDVDDEQAARIVLADNRTAELGGYDDRELADLLEQLPELDGTGWGRRDLDRLLDELARSGGDADRDTEPGPVPAKPRTRPGDVYRLGEHRLVCGSSTDPATVARALEPGPAEMVWTDPPYGVDYHARTGVTETGFAQYGVGATFANDGAGELQVFELVHGALRLAAEHANPGAAIYLAHPDVRNPVFRRALDEAGWEIHQTLVWVKQTFVMGRQDYHWQHEPILYGWRRGAGHRWHGGRADSTLIDDEPDPRNLDKRELVALVRQLRNERATDTVREDRPLRADLHPTVKPVGLVARHVGNSSRRGEIVYDPFAGSGSTLIACENLGRRCTTVELEPGYCDVIVDRWLRHTGQRSAELERG